MNHSHGSWSDVESSKVKQSHGKVQVESGTVTACQDRVK